MANVAADSSAAGVETVTAAVPDELPRAQELAGEGGRVADKAVAGSAKAVTQTLERGPVDHVRAPAQHALHEASGVLPREPKGLLPAVKALLPATGSAGLAGGTIQPPPASSTATPPAAGALPFGQAVVLDGMTQQGLGASAGAEPLLLRAAAADFAGSPRAGRSLPPAAPVGSTSFHRPGDRSDSPSSPAENGPAQPPESSHPIASGAGSPSIPIVALLALLALVAPAIFRRLREVPSLRAPAPFVCALERPG